MLSSAAPMKIGTQQVARSVLPMPFLRRDFSSVSSLSFISFLRSAALRENRPFLIWSRFFGFFAVTRQ